MGWSGAAISSDPGRPPVIAVAAPSSMLVAEAISLVALAGVGGAFAFVLLGGLIARIA